MTLFPLFADLKGRAVLVVGGGAVATRKTEALLQAGALVTVGAPELGETLRGLRDTARIAQRAGLFEPAWLDTMWLVIAATDDAAVNAQVAQAAGARRMLVNVVDNPALSSFQVPSIVDRSPLVVAISSSGVAPVLARRMREHIESLFDHTLGPLACLSAKFRLQIRRQRADMGPRRAFYDWLLDGPVAALLRQARPEQAEAALVAELNKPAGPLVGSVVLVGAGPGDPGLLTLKALRALNEADVILYDKLVSDEVMSLARRDADRIAVGKQPGEDHHATQVRIHALLVEHAQAGKRVVRLKGGDPFIFGRGGEELEHLRAHGVRYEVVPGVTAAMACAAYAGIPLTHRAYAQSLHLATAHGAADADTIDWKALARERQTLAFYMGVAQLDTLSRQLIEHGRDAATPVAIVENGSRPEQRVLATTLGELPGAAGRHELRSPALLIVGEVAALAGPLSWFGHFIQNQAATPGAGSDHEAPLVQSAF